MNSPLKSFANYSTQRIPLKKLTLDNYVTTDNILQNKQGKVNAVNLPPQGGNVTKYSKGDILISNIRPYLKKIWHAQTEGGSSADVLTLKVNSRNNPKFIYYALFRDEFFDHMMNGSKGTKMPRGDKNQILSFPIPVFDRFTQDKIAKVLSDLDAKIELNNRINVELEGMAKLIYDYWFVQFDFPISVAQAQAMGKPELEGKPYKSSGRKMVYNEELKREIPEGWAVKAISTLFEVKDGTHDSPKPSEKGFHLITSKHLMKGGIDFNSAYLISETDYNNVNKRSRVDQYDILLSMIGTIGTVYYVQEEEINFAIKNMGLFKTSESPLFAEYVYSYLNSVHGEQYFISNLSGSIQNYLTLGSLRTIPFLVPEESVLKSYNELSKPFFDKMYVNNKQNQQLSSLRDWLLPMLMNGQVKVGEVAENLSLAAEPEVNYGG